MKIGISGAQSTGKTTLLNALRSEKYFHNYDIRNEVTRTIREYGIDINEKGSDTSQLLIMREHVYNLCMFDNMLTDRTSLDGLVYSSWLFNEGKITPACLEEVMRVFERTITKYDYIFYIKPEFAIEDDGIRSASQQWQQEIQAIFENIIDLYAVPVIHISGSVRQRVDAVLTNIGAI